MFNKDKDWIVTGRGFAEESETGYSIGLVKLDLGAEGTDQITLMLSVVTPTSFKLMLPTVAEPPTGTYPDAGVEVSINRPGMPQYDILVLPLKVVVD